MKELKELNLQELESVAGGFSMNQLTPEERERLAELRRHGTMAWSLNYNGMMSDEEYDAIIAEFQAYTKMLTEKYG